MSLTPQDLWDKIEWQTEGPHVVVASTAPATTTIMSDDSIVAYFGGNAQYRLPPLWKTRGGRILTKADLNSTTTTITTPTACNHIATERLEQCLINKVETTVLPNLVLASVLEEGLHQVIAKAASASSSTTSSSGGGTQTTSTSLHSSSAPKYYTTSPHSYLMAPSPSSFLENDDLSSTNIGFAPLGLLQRIKSACILAYNYNNSLENYNQSTNNSVEMSSDSRRSSRRLAPPTQPHTPNPLVKGGKTSLYFIENYEKQQQQEENSSDQQAADESKQDEPDANDNDDDNDVVMQQQEEEEDETYNEDDYKEDSGDDDDDEEEPDDDAKDADFHPEDVSEEEDDEEEEEDESLDEDEELDPQASSSEEEESSDDESTTESDFDDEVDLILQNPHFQPTLSSILDWMGRRGKSLSMANIQQAIVVLLRDAISLPITQKWDQVVIRLSDTQQQQHALFNSNDTPRVVLECTTGESWKQLQKLESSEFSKCKFCWKVMRNASLLGENQQLLEKHYYAELEYKRQKAWATWRFKGVSTGYTVWPQWLEAATAYRQEETKSLGGGVEALASGGGDEPQESTAAAAAASTTASTTAASASENADLALAKAMEQQEAAQGGGGRRRTTRRGGGDAGAVFYGGQSGMSHKQLMDTIVRMAYQHSFQTIVALQALVAEESSNPVDRIRVALGKLLWKSHQVTRVRVNSEWTDMALWKSLQQNQALLQVPAQLKTDDDDEDNEAMEENGGNDDESSPASAPVALPIGIARNLPTEENLKHLEILTRYIQNLHKTELELRSLILNHLTTTQIVTVATAADERPSSQEAVDAVHFEGNNHSSLNWSSTGHDLLNKIIFRPSFLMDNQDSPECTWYKTKDFVPSVPMPPADDDARSDGRPPREVFGKEPLGVERRMRFRAYPVTEDGVELGEGAILVLTEGQVHAGIMAAALERKKEAAAAASADHPFAIGAGTNITLQSQEEGVTSRHCQVAGFDTVPLENGQGDDLEHRILLLPASSEASDGDLAFWAIANLDENGILTCRPVGSSTMYKILQSDCDSSSSAFQECQGIIEFLYQQTHSAVFAEPVDPVALKIPTYFSVIKHPMDISTVASNLEKGVYSKIPPGQNVGRSPVARMLNGPFKDDVVRIFDNAMLFNPPDDWIHHTAATMKRTVLKKIDQVSQEADDRFRSFSPRKKKSMYVDYDSDVDMYEYESDKDDEEYGRRAVRKRKRVRAKEDFSTVAIEAPVSLRKTLSESVGLRGPFSNLPINSEAEGYSISSEWHCRHRTASSPEETKQDAEELKRKQEMEELLMLHRQVEEEERAGLRRSSRAHPTAVSNGDAAPATAPNDFEYFLANDILPPIGDEEADALLKKTASSRSEVESHRESLHEVYFAKLYQQLGKFLQPVDKDYGTYVNSSFPPFLGRVMPSLAPGKLEDVTWEIRAPYVLPAIQWVLRGLIHSGHLSELDPDVLITNDIYYADDSQQPFDVLDMKEMQRRKRAFLASEEEESEEEVEMSAYEKLRAERVARNAERLKALGLA